MARCVLISEDDQSIASMVREILEDEGYEVHLTMGAASMRAIRHLRPHILLLDNNMPGMTGVEVARQVRSDPALRGIAIITMTAGDQLGMICRQMDADGCLGKPFELDALVSVVDEQRHSGHA